MKTGWKIILGFSLCLLLAVPALAGDIQITNGANQTIKIFNGITQDIYIVAIMNNNAYIPFSLVLKAGEEAQLQSEAIPAVSFTARCLPEGSSGELAGYTRNADGFYYITVYVI